MSGTASFAHISGLPQQTVAGSSAQSHSVQLVQPVTSISLVSQQQQQVTPASSVENTSLLQQAANGDRCFNSSVSLSGNIDRLSSQSSQLQTESCETSKAVLSQLALTDILQSSQAVSDAAKSCSQSQSACVNQLQQLGQSKYADEHNGSQNQISSAHLHSDNHSLVIEQLQQTLLQSSSRQAVNGCHVAATDDNRRLSADVCRGEEGEVDSNELMQFLS